jgi:hypothetical protein
MAENSRIGSAPTTSFSARLSNAAYGAPAELTKRPGPAQPDVGLSSTKA